MIVGEASVESNDTLLAWCLSSCAVSLRRVGMRGGGSGGHFEGNDESLHYK